MTEMLTVRARVAETFAAASALERLLARVQTLVFSEMVFVLE